MPLLFLVCRLEELATDKTFSKVMEIASSDVGTYLPLSVIIEREGGMSGPLGRANLSAALSYCRRTRGRSRTGFFVF